MIFSVKQGFSRETPWAVRCLPWPALIKIAEAYEVLRTAYADNVIIAGPLSSVLTAQEMYRKEMGALGLQLNAGESEIYILE